MGKKGRGDGIIQGISTLVHIAQEDHPNSDFATLAEMVEVIDLEPEMSQATLGGQALPVLPGEKCNN